MAHRLSGTNTANLRVVSLRALQPPSCVLEDVPGDISVYSQVIDARAAVTAIAADRRDVDDRLLVVVGPPRESRDASGLKALGEELAQLSLELKGDILIMLMADPAMNLSSESGSGSHSVNRKMRNARETLLELNRLGLPTAVEFRDTITPQFFADLLVGERFRPERGSQRAGVRPVDAGRAARACARRRIAGPVQSRRAEVSTTFWASRRRACAASSRAQATRTSSRSSPSSASTRPLRRRRRWVAASTRWRQRSRACARSSSRAARR